MTARTLYYFCWAVFWSNAVFAVMAVVWEFYIAAVCFVVAADIALIRVKAIRGGNNDPLL